MCVCVFVCVCESVCVCVCVCLSVCPSVVCVCVCERMRASVHVVLCLRPCPRPSVQYVCVRTLPISVFFGKNTFEVQYDIVLSLLHDALCRESEGERAERKEGSSSVLMPSQP